MTENLELDGITYEIEEAGRRGLTLTISRNGTKLERLVVNPRDLKDRTLAHEALRNIDANIPWAEHLRHIALNMDGGGLFATRLNILEVAGLVDPPPLLFRIEGLVPEGYPANLYGDGGQGKSYLGVAASTAVAMGRPFLGLRTIKGTVLYLDYELDAEEFTRRAYRVARGMSFKSPPAGLLYANVSLPLLSIRADIEATIRTHNVDFLIVDSLGPASGGNPSASELVIPTMQTLRDLHIASLVIDHQAKMQQGQEYSAKTPYGSAYKGNLARSVWQIERGEGGEHILDILMSHRKTNFGPLMDAIGVRVTFDGPSVRFERAEPGDIASLAQKLPAKAQVEAELRTGSGTPEELADATGLREGTVRNALTRLKKEGKADSEGGTWRLIPDSFTTKGNESGIVSEATSDPRASVLTIAESLGWPQDVLYRHPGGASHNLHMGREDHWQEWAKTAPTDTLMAVMEALETFE